MKSYTQVPLTSIKNISPHYSYQSIKYHLLRKSKRSISPHYVTIRKHSPANSTDFHNLTPIRITKMKQSQSNQKVFSQPSQPMKTYYEKKLLTTDDQLQPSEPYEYSPQHNETLLNDTIDQLDVLEQKISVIMEKNAQLRSILKKSEDKKFQENIDPKAGKQNNSSVKRQDSFLKRQNTTPIKKFDFSHNKIINVELEDSSPYINRTTTRTNASSCGKFKEIINNINFGQNKLKNGRHKQKCQNGQVYDGDYVNGMKSGLGTLFSSKGSIVYQGEWKCDMYHGRGKLNNQRPHKEQLKKEMFLDFDKINETWKYYEGEFKDGVKQGLGLMVFMDNERYQGHFKEDIFHGTGTVFNQNKEIILQGFWQKGKFIV